jgi:hypothetical protein
MHSFLLLRKTSPQDASRSCSRGHRVEKLRPPQRLLRPALGLRLRTSQKPARYGQTSPELVATIMCDQRRRAQPSATVALRARF